MNKKLEMAQDKFVASIGKLAESFGFNQFTAQLYAVLYMSDKPLSLDELVGRLQASKGNVSINIRELENWGAVKSVWIKGSRKDYYEADPDIKKVAINKLRTGARNRIEHISNMIEEFKELTCSAEGEMTSEDRKTVKAYTKKLKKIEEMKGRVTTVLALAEKLF